MEFSVSGEEAAAGHDGPGTPDGAQRGGVPAEAGAGWGDREPQEGTCPQSQWYHYLIPYP